MPITEEKRLYLKEYRQKNKVHIAKVSKANYDKNKEAILEKQNKKYNDNPQHFLRLKRESIKRNGVSLRVKWKKDYEKYKDKKLIQLKTRRHFSHLKKKGCQGCGSKRKKLTFHHPEPYKYDIFEILCWECHGKHHSYNNFLDNDSFERMTVK